ncbi:hydroxypyruvate isomerase family protein [Halomonas denitrificans]|uniref:2-oxo-tetronate isomerase n=1 Tax=Halomonas denitrificans TaxID=370769 RepID=UPI001CD4047A|nr:2-oxo-tetronate isomerase [Halomonas denitrificans]MCA0975527.1 hydroxypyruvate isomerase family protein [Halomonas denitrificans]
MIRLAANLSMMFTEHDFLDRFSAAAKAGFRGVEYLFPYDFPASELRARLDDQGLTQVLFNLPPGDWEAGERGLAGLPGREQAFRDGLERALEYAQALDCPRVHAMAGLLPDNADPATRDAYLKTYIDNLSYAAERCGQDGRTLLIEPINGRDMPGYLLQHQVLAREVIRRVGSPHLRLQFDLYHCQIMQGDLMRTLEQQFAQVGHVQIAGVPERHEPDQGELNIGALLEHLDAQGYDGWVGCEYRPRAGTVAGLGWARPYGIIAGHAEETP